MVGLSGLWGESESDSIPKPFILGIPRHPESKLSQYAREVYQKVFAQIGVPVKFMGCVPKKCPEYVKTEEIDGEVARIMEYGDKYTYMTRVNIPIIKINAGAFVLDSNIKLETLEDIVAQKLKVSALRGYYFMEKFYANYPGFSTVETIEEGIASVLSGKIDVYIEVRETVEEYLQVKEQKEKIHLAGVIFKPLLYPFVHEKNRALVPKMEKALKDLKENGILMLGVDQSTMP